MQIYQDEQFPLSYTVFLYGFNIVQSNLLVYIWTLCNVNFKCYKFDYKIKK